MSGHPMLIGTSDFHGRELRFVSEWNTAPGFASSLRALGHHVDDRLVSVQVRRAGDDVAAFLSTHPDDLVTELKRQLLVDDQPFLVVTQYLVERLYPGLGDVDLSTRSLAENLESRYGVRFSRRELWIESIRPSRHDQRLLGLKAGAPCLLIEQVHFSSEDTPVVFSRAIVRGDRCRHHVRLDWP